MNAQNFEKTHKKNPKKGAIRKSLKAPEGEQVVVADSGQVEARGTGWVAGHTSLIEVFADRKRSVYLEFGAEVYGRTITKADEQEYFVAKTATLGLGFQMGWPKFSATLIKGAMGGPPVRFKEADADAMGIDVLKFAADKKRVEKVRRIPTRLAIEDMIIHCAVCEKIVYKYRDRNQPIVDLWKMMEIVIGCMADGDEVTFGPGNVFQTVKDGILMPNGLTLQYPGLRRRNKGYSREQWEQEQASLPVEDREDFDEEQSWGSGFSYMGGKGGRQRVKIYGGLATENLIQSLCRIIVGEQMLRIRAKYGWEPVLMAHDEIVLIVRNEEAEFAKAMCLEEMRVAPSWAMGFPLNAEVGSGQSYGEAK
jgi:DNA polymerase